MTLIAGKPMTVADLARLIMKWQEDHPEDRPKDYHKKRKKRSRSKR